MRKRLELRRNLWIEVLQDTARRGSDGSRVGIAQHGHGDCRARPLEQIDVNGWLRRRIEAVFVSVAHDPDDGEQTQVAIHVSKLDGVADGILIWPAIARQRFADHGNVRRIRAVALVEDSATNEGDSENLEVSVRDDAEVRAAEAFFLLAQRTKTIRGFGHLVLGHQ